MAALLHGSRPDRSCLPVFGKGLVELHIQLAGRIVGDVEQGDGLLASALTEAAARVVAKAALTASFRKGRQVVPWAAAVGK